AHQDSTDDRDRAADPADVGRCGHRGVGARRQRRQPGLALVLSPCAGDAPGAGATRDGARPSMFGGMMGAIGGFMLGGLLGGLLFGGLGAGAGIGMLDILLIAGGVFLLFKFMQARRQRQ